MSGVHCQSQLISVGNPARAGCDGLQASPSMASKRGVGFFGGRTVIWMFQKTGSRFIGGHRFGSRSAAAGENNTKPPSASCASAFAQLFVTRISSGIVE